MRLEDIGFYTLSDQRAATTSGTSPMMRGEIILTDRCNYKCPYCRGLKHKGDLDFKVAELTLVEWMKDRLRNVRFSGGEPTLYKNLPTLVRLAKSGGVERIAVSTNGSRPWQVYAELLEAGVNDFSVSLDACCAADATKMAGGVDRWERVTTNIERLSKRCYTTVGVVLTPENLQQALGTIKFAHQLGVNDVRVIPAAQEGQSLVSLEDVPLEVLNAHPILQYRLQRAAMGKSVRGISEDLRCHLVKDDSAVSGGYHFPCVIYLREQGSPIGRVSTSMRQDRLSWFAQHRPLEDKICRENCLDVCVDYNKKCEAFQSLRNS